MESDAIPEGFQSYSADPRSEEYRARKLKDNSLPFCREKNHGTYVAKNGDSFSSRGCVSVLDDETSIKGDNSIFIPTYFRDTWTHQTSGKDCTLLKLCCGKNNFERHQEKCEKGEMSWHRF